MSAPIIPDEFMEWFRKNYPGPDTIIYKPDWHAPRVYQAAIHASRSDPTQDERVQALEAENARLRGTIASIESAPRHAKLADHDLVEWMTDIARAALRDLEGGE